MTFLLVFLPPLFGTAQIKEEILCSQFGTLISCSGGSKDLFHRLLCTSNLPEWYQGGWFRTLIFVLPTSKHRLEKWWALLKNTARQTNQPRFLGQMITVKTYNRLCKTQDQKLGEYLQKIRTSKKTCVCRELKKNLY